MRIDLAGWESEGLRSPDIAVDLMVGGSIPQVTLIQMPNGTGKTTTLNMIRAALSGVATRWTTNEIRDYRRKGDTRSKGRFSVTLLVDGRPLTFEVNLDFDQGIATYTTTNPGSGGYSPGWHPPPQVHRFLSEQFIDLFVFDGEFAGRLLDSRKSEAQRAVDALCELYLLEDVADFAEKSWMAAANKAGPKSKQGLTRAQNDKDRVEKRIVEIERAKAAAESEIQQLAKDIEQLSSKVESHISGIDTIRDEYDEAGRALVEAQRLVEEESLRTMNSARMPHALHPLFGNSMVALKNELDRLKLPENTSAQFFNELLDEELCICGREMNEAARSQIRLRSKEYLGEAEAGDINAIKRDVERYLGDPAGQGPTLDERVSNLSKAVRARNLAAQKVRTLEQRLIDQGDEQLRLWKQSLDDKTRRRDELDVILRRINGDESEYGEVEQIFSLRVLNARLKELNKQISTISGTLTLRRQTELIKAMAQQIVEVSRAAITQSLLQVCNSRLREVLSNDPIEISSIDKSIHIGQSGASVGQTLAVGYTFLMSVLGRGQNEFPLVVDSPAGPLDPGRRREVGRLIPELCSQFVAFTISTERAAFVDSLEKATDGLRYLTLFRKTDGTTPLLENLPASGVVETESAALVDSRDYFVGFDMEEEL